MGATPAHSLLAMLAKRLSDASSLSAVGDALEYAVAETLDHDQISVRVFWKGQVRAVRENDPQPPFRFDSGSLVISGIEPGGPLYISNPNAFPVPESLSRYFEELEVRSYALLPLQPTGQAVHGAIELHTRDSYVRWRKEDRAALESIAMCVALFLDQKTVREDSNSTLGEVAAPAQTVLPQSEAASEVESVTRSQRLLEYGNLIILRTDPQFVVKEVFGNTQRALGLNAEDLKGDLNVWQRFMLREDLRRLIMRIRRMENKPEELSEEIRIRHQETDQLRWIMLKGVPLYSPEGEFIGWEGFGIDITEKRATEEELLSQRRRIEALYEVSKSLVVNMDPALVTLKGLRALIQATDSDAGIGCFYDTASGRLELVAAEGVSEKYIEDIAEVIDGTSMVRYCVENREGMCIEDIQQDDRAATSVASREGLRSTIVMPLIFESSVLGAIVIFCKSAGRYRDADYDLVRAASSQIALAARQAEVYAAERRHADSLGAMYRLSHELSKVQQPKEVAEHAFPIIQEELSCKRLWLGVINDQGTHVVGKGGFGPGIRRNVIDLQVELDLRHDFLDEAIRTKQAVIVKPGQEMECSGLNRLLRRLELQTFIIVPLVSLGQVVGVFIVEPSVASTFFVERKLPLLTSMASEIASVILTRRFEAKMADAEKMRMAGLLASGVAHNFNNMLQAIMGQSSLIEMQLPEDSKLRASARTIIESAGKGAALIKQLLSFSTESPSSREVISIVDFIQDSKELYQSILGSKVMLELDLNESSPHVSVDYSKIQQTITNLLMNAREAVLSGEGGHVKISTKKVRVRSGEIDPELAPGSYLRIDIEDDGVGMDQERQARCFEPFYTTKNADSSTGIGFEGTGLGLSSAYSTIKQHEGIITVRSSPGEGSMFSVYLPAANVISQESLGTVAPELSTLEAVVYKVGSESIFSVKSTLESLGLRLHQVQEKQGLLELLERNKETIQLVVLDIDRAGSDPIRLIEDLLKSAPGVSVLTTSVDDRRWSALLKPFSSVEVVEKPIGVWAIHNTVKEILNRLKERSGLSEAIIMEKVVPNGSAKEAKEEELDADQDETITAVS